MAEKALKQPDTFIWTGTDKRGVRVKGQTRGSNPSLIKADLRKQGIKPITVKKQSVLFQKTGKKKIIPKDIAVFFRQLATMMSAGVPLVQSFDIIGRGHDNLGMRQLILKIKNEVESGTSLSETLAKHPYYFDDLVVNLVEAGEHRLIATKPGFLARTYSLQLVGGEEHTLAIELLSVDEAAVTTRRWCHSGSLGWPHAGMEPVRCGWPTYSASVTHVTPICSGNTSSWPEPRTDAGSWWESRPDRRNSSPAGGRESNLPACPSS